MKIFNKLFLTLIIMFFGMATFAGDYSTYKMDNGQTVIIKEVHDNPVVIIDTWINTGSINESDKNSGVAHFLEHLFFKGTQKHPSNEFDRILESKGAVTNAATSKDFTHYYILIPSKDFNLAMNLHADMLLNPLIPRKEMEKERKVVLEEISKNNDNPRNILYIKMNEQMYKNHPYKREVIGSSKVIETITRDDVLDFYNKWYLPSNMTTIVVGDVDTQKVLDSVKRNFTSKTNKNIKLPSVSYKQDPKPCKPIEVTTPLNVQTDYMLMAFKGCSSAKQKDSYTLDVLATILGDGKTSRLYKNLKDQKQLVSDISAGHASYKEDSLFYVSANFAPEDVDKIKPAIVSEIQKIKDRGVDEEELQKAKNIIERDTYYSRESVSNIANEIGYTVVLTGDTNYYANYIDNIKKVTTADIQNAAKKYLDMNSVVVSTVVPEGYKKENIKTESKNDVKAKVISSSKTITKYELPNKAILVINKNDANDIIAVDISVKGGSNTEKIKGLGSIVAESMIKGTKKYPSQELALKLEETGIRIVPQMKPDVFSISSKFTKNESEVALDLLNEVINNANLDVSSVEKVKSDKLNAIKTMRDNPSSVVFDEFKYMMWRNTPYCNASKVTEKTVPTIKRADVVGYYNGLFNPGNIVISINGNVDNQQMINYFSNLFSTKSLSTKVNLKSYAGQFPSFSQNRYNKVIQDTNTAWIAIGWRTDGLTNKKDWATLQVIDSLLGSGMSSRLFYELRDQQGLAYQVGSSFAANYNKGVFAVYIGTNPKTVETSKKGLLDQITRLKKEFVSDKELAQAKDKLLGNYVLSLETNMSKAATVGWFESSDRGYQFMDEYPDLIQNVTIQDIITVANKYFSEPYVMSIVGPKK